MNRIHRFFFLWLIAALVALPLRGFGQSAEQPAAFSKEELEQLVAPIALFPDALVAQILMASTYTLEVVSAARWVKANAKVTGAALEDAMQKQSWDPSVKSLAAFPQVLAMMNERLEMTQKLGDAFLGQQKDVMDAVQRLRAKAHAAGNLKTTKEQKVTTEQQGGTTIIKIEPADPQIVYVPVYNPTVVYGPWPYPYYPPYYYYPPGYVAGTAFLTFTAAIIVGHALWGDCHWGRGDVSVNINHYNNFNRTNIQHTNWQHNVEHRKGVQYRDTATQQKYGRGQRQGAETREAYRGRADPGRQDLTRGAAVSSRRGGGVGDRHLAFEGIGSGSQTRSFSDRGAASRSVTTEARGGARGGAGGGGRTGGRRKSG